MEINLRDVLVKEQFYVVELSEKFGLEVKAIKHDVATDTCFEKADLLGWDVKKIIKAIFFGGEGKLYGLVFPEFGTRENQLYFSKRDLGKILRKTNKEMKKFHNSSCPLGMEKGTCTPFVPETAFEDDGFSTPLEKIFIHNIPDLDKSLIDISIGGYGEDAHKISLHLNYEEIYKILNYKFGDRIQKLDFFENV